MTQIYAPTRRKLSLSLILPFLILNVLSSFGQTTTITTTGAAYTGNNSLGNPAQISFVLTNNNAYPILIKGIGNWCTTSENNSVWSLIYSTTSLSGPSTDVTIAPWTLIATSSPTPVTATGITPLNFPALAFTMPAGAKYRFALRNTGPGSTIYSGTGSNITPNTFSGGGVTLDNGDVVVAGNSVGYSGNGTGLTLTPRYFTGFITFEPAGPCTSPPVPGTVTSTANPVCLGIPFTLSLSGSTGGTGQTYQWQISTDNSNWNDIPLATGAALTTSQTSSNYYRCRLTCGGNTANTPGYQVLTPAAVSGTFTINSALPTGGTNFNSYNAAYNYIKCGIAGPVIFNTAPGSGPYTEQLIMDAVPGASAVNTVTFNGNGTTLQFLSANTNERAVIKLNNADYITFDSLTIKALGTTTTEYGFGVQLINNADSNNIRNCNIQINTTSTSSNYAGIVVNSSATSATTTGNTLCDNNIFDNNTITGGYYGITLVGSTTVSVQRNQVTRNRLKDQYLYSMYLLGNFDALIEANDITKSVTTISAATSYGIYVTSLNTKLIISKNRIHDIFNAQATTTNDFYGITLTGTDALATLENVVVNNAIYNIKGNGTIYGIYNSSSDNVWYYHNTVAIDDVASTSTETTRGFYQVTVAGGIELKNNTITIRRGGTAVKHCIYMGTTTTTYISNNNNFYINAGGTTNYIGYNGTNQATLANWQAAATQDANSISADPLYANAPAGLLQPTNASVNDLGANLSSNYPVATDIINAARTIANPDMGAWEFMPGACVAPPTPGTSTTSISGPICPNTPGTFSLTGNSIGLGQTYQWQFSTNIAGPYTSISSPSTNPSFSYNVQQTGYFRAVVTCSGITANAVPVLVNVSSALPGGTYTINKTLPTAGTNFTSFNHAYQAMKCGITGPIILNVVSGTGPYNEQLLMDPVPGSSAVNTITWNGNGNAIAFASTNTNERGVIRLNGSSHMIFDSLVVNCLGTTTSEYGHGFHLQNDADSNIIRKCTVNMDLVTTSANYAGIVIAGGNTATTSGTNKSDFNIIENNTVRGGYYGITIAGSTTDRTTSNIIRGNTIEDGYQYGVYISSTDNSVVEKNNISRPARTGLAGGYGIYVTNPTGSLKVSKNRIHHPFTASPTSTSTYYCIYLTGADATAGQNNEVSNNIIYNFDGAGAVYCLYNSSSDNINYFHNTVDISDPSAASTGSTYGFYQTGEATGLDIRNNIFTLTRGGTGTRYGLYMVTTTTVYNSNNNDLYVPGPNGITGYNGTNRVTLADWQAATGKDAASVSVLPFYISPATGNYEPISPLLDNKGTNAGVTTDIRDAARSVTTPDPGAYEFAVPACTTPPPASAATASPNTGICMGTAIRLTLSGITYSAGQTYQWQTATSAAGPYTNIGNLMTLPDTTIISTATLYYRCVVTCSGVSTLSSPAVVTLNAAFLAGTYTINNTIPTGGINFNSFNEAVAALYCGITGHVIFNVAAGTYTEQVRVGNIPGTGPSATVTFQSANGVASSATLTFASTAAATNYTLKLDSANYFIFNALTINGTNTTNGRVIELGGTATNSVIRNCVINAPVATSGTTAIAGIFASTLKGDNRLSIVKNTINGGSYGIYMVSASATPSLNNIIDTNTINGSFQYNAYFQYMNYVKLRANIFNISAPRAATTYGLYMVNNDSAITVSNNTVNISGVTTTFYSMYFSANRANTTTSGLIAGNRVLATTGNTGVGYGIYQTGGINQKFVNNIVSLNTTAGSAYGLYHTSGNVQYFNNSINNISTTTSINNYAAYMSQTSGSQSDARNNIFAHNNSGRAIYMANSNFVYSDYNMLYTNGATLGTFGSAAINTFRKWVDTTGWDYNSIMYKPAFVSNTDLTPDIAAPEVWGIHGRGVQIAGNNSDFNGNSRPVTLQAGVPDLGAYEFVPTSVPVALVATPPAPAPNTTQKFSLGTDTVSIIKWGASVPTTITGKRYTGVQPPGLATGQKYMYFYTDYDVTGGSNYNYEMTQDYMDPWLGFIPNESVIKMGRTDAGAAWIVSSVSTVDTLGNAIKEGSLSFIDKYTGLTDGLSPTPPIDPVVLDSSNSGTRFWVGYGHHEFFTGANNQQMVLYLGGSPQPSNVTVRINGTPWIKNYSIPANTVITSDIITKSGLYDARLLEEGFSQRGISITSDVPIVAYAHIYGSASSGATMLLPVGTYGYDYTALTSRQNYASDCFSWFYIVADRNNTKIEITPSKLTRAGRAPGVPFVVTLNKGEVYQVLGEIDSGAEGFDLTGSKAKAIPNSEGKCLPFAFFSGSSRTAIGCGTSAGGSGDNIIQQNFPFQAWGKKYLTAPTSNSAAANSLQTNIFRVAVRDPLTKVYLNNSPTPLPYASLINNLYYQFEAAAGTYIEADKPITVAQFISSSASCPNTPGDGDPEMFYLSPIEQGIKKVSLFRNTQQAITINYLTLIIPTTGVASLTIDGSNTFDYTYVHPVRSDYTVVVKRWTAAQTQTIVKSDSAFTAITYGLGSVESYGYNAGTLVKNLNSVSSISNTLGTGGTSPYTCKGTPFRFKVSLTVKPSQLTWHFSQVPNLTPNTDVTQNNPQVIDSVLVNGVWFYNYTVPQDYVYNGTGTFIVPVNLVHPSIESCNSSLDITVSVTVLPEPITDFTYTFSGCVGDLVQFNGSSATSNGVPVNQWSWNFGDATTSTLQNPTKLYATPDNYIVQFKAVANDGCVGSTTKTIVVNNRPVVALVADSLSTCINTNATWTVLNPVAGATYNWYNAPTGGTLLGTGTSFTISNVTTTTIVWVEAVINTCNSATRKRAVTTVLPLLTPPVAVVDSVGADLITFKWNAVPNALSYSVSTNNGVNWQTPSSGPAGLTHRITGLAPLTSVTLLVRANGGCQDAVSQPVTGKTFTDQIYFPNTFTPNGDGRNDTWQVYGYIIKSMRMMIFNQWGEKVYESRVQSQGWDGKYKGKRQPSGVYMYVAELILTDGTKKTYKGSINLVQ